MAGPTYESEMLYWEERRKEKEEYDATLEELEKIGWPCRLRELPALYTEACRELDALQSVIKAALGNLRLIPKEYRFNEVQQVLSLLEVAAEPNKESLENKK